jgi:uncharacterized protein (DUF1684 family)
MQTYSDHLKASAEITAHIQDGDALARKMAHILNNARTTLEALKVFAPDDRFKISLPMHLRQSENPNNNERGMKDMIDMQISAINNTLGDRAK